MCTLVSIIKNTIQNIHCRDINAMVSTCNITGTVQIIYIYILVFGGYCGDNDKKSCLSVSLC